MDHYSDDFGSSFKTFLRKEKIKPYILLILNKKNAHN